MLSVLFRESCRISGPSTHQKEKQACLDLWVGFRIFEGRNSVFFWVKKKISIKFKMLNPNLLIFFFLFHDEEGICGGPSSGFIGVFSHFLTFFADFSQIWKFKMRISFSKKVLWKLWDLEILRMTHKKFSISNLFGRSFEHQLVHSNRFRDSKK